MHSVFQNLKVEYSSIVVLKALAMRYNPVEESFIQSQRSYSSEEPAVTWPGEHKTDQSRKNNGTYSKSYSNCATKIPQCLLIKHSSWNWQFTTSRGTQRKGWGLFSLWGLCVNPFLFASHSDLHLRAEEFSTASKTLGAGGRLNIHYQPKEM